jgi:hypothetical protein
MGSVMVCHGASLLLTRVDAFTGPRFPLEYVCGLTMIHHEYTAFDPAVSVAVRVRVELSGLFLTFADLVNQMVLFSYERNG